MTAIHQQRRDNTKRIVELLLVIYDSKKPEYQRTVFSDAVGGDAKRCSIQEQRDWLARLEIIAGQK